MTAYYSRIAIDSPGENGALQLQTQSFSKIQNTSLTHVYHKLEGRNNTDPLLDPAQSVGIHNSSFFDGSSVDNHESGYSILGPETREGEMNENSYAAPNAQVNENSHRAPNAQVME